MRKISADERRARLATRHHLSPAARAGSPEEVAGSLVAVHATDPATVYLSLGARLADPDLGGIEQALYDRGGLIRMHGMRRTAFVVPAHLVPVVHHSSTVAVAARQWDLVRTLAARGGYDQRWLDEVEAGALAALATLGTATAAELSTLEPRLAEQVEVGAGKSYAAKQAIGTHLLTALGMQGRIVRRRPRGTWISGQFRWALAPEVPQLPVGDAKRDLVRGWLAAFGPGTETDLKWWTGWTLTEVRRALAAAGAEQVAIDDGTGFVLPDDVDPVDGGEPWAALLPALDSTSMGWRHRDWYLAPEHVPALFDANGNAGPTIWWNGRVVGGWALPGTGEVVWRLLEEPGADARAAIAAEAGRLAAWIGQAKVTPRFRTPLERELRSEGRR